MWEQVYHNIRNYFPKSLEIPILHILHALTEHDLVGKIIITLLYTLFTHFF